MENIHHDGREFTVEEVPPRPAGWSCRHLVSTDNAHQFLEYLVSVGPYKVDVARIHKLTTEQIAAFESGKLMLGELARRLAEPGESAGNPSRPRPDVDSRRGD